MTRRLEIELTSSSNDGAWTWRAAGARQPKGNLNGSLVPEGAAVGDVVRADVEDDVEGVEVIFILAPKGSRKEPQLLEMLGSGRDEQLVTTTLAPKGKGGRGRGRDGNDRGRGRGRDGGRGGRDGGKGRGREGGRGDNRGNKGGDDRNRQDRKKGPSRPKAPRLRAGRTHRQAALAALPDLQRPLADEVLKGGVPGLRQAVDQMNEKASAEGMPKIKTAPLVGLAEKLAPTLKAAEWRDRAEAALVGIAEIDLRDIRSVVVASDNAARDEETRELADKLREGLAARVDAEQRAWLDELAKTIADGRTVRALRLSSRPPKAGSPIPSDMAERLAASAAASMTSETSQDRWATMLDALAYSPVRTQVVPEGLPESPKEPLLTAVRKVATRVPAIAALFGVDAPAAGKKRGKRKPPPPPPPPAAEAKAPVSAETPPADESAKAETPPAAESAAPADESAKAETPETTDGDAEKSES